VLKDKFPKFKYVGRKCCNAHAFFELPEINSTLHITKDSSLRDIFHKIIKLIQIEINRYVQQNKKTENTQVRQL